MGRIVSFLSGSSSLSETMLLLFLFLLVVVVGRIVSFLSGSSSLSGTMLLLFVGWEGLFHSCLVLPRYQGQCCCCSWWWWWWEG